MDFYSMLSKYYDDIFPFGEQKFTFLKECLDNNGKILDVGAGTGTYSIPFARMGYKVLAFDSEETMVERMLEKSDNLEEHVAFRMTMEDMGNLESDNFDLIYCIGNTLVHLGNVNAVAEFLKEAYQKLQPGGHLVLQIVNYDKVFNESVSELPLIRREQEGLQFRRTYVLNQQKVCFKGQLEVNIGSEKQEYNSETVLLGLRKQTLLSMLQGVGFEFIETYGDFAKNPYSENSSALVIRCKK